VQKKVNYLHNATLTCSNWPLHQLICCTAANKQHCVLALLRPDVHERVQQQLLGQQHGGWG
jgi:hypothetical protein